MTEQEYERFKDYFIQSDLISEDELKRLTSRIGEGKELSLEQLLMDEKSLTERQILIAKSSATGIPFCDLDDHIVVEKDILKQFDRDTLIRNCCIPIGYDKYEDPPIATFAVYDPQNNEVVDEISGIMGNEVELNLLLGGKAAVLKQIDKYYPLSESTNSLDVSTKPVRIVQTAGRNQLGDFAPMFAHLNDDVLFGEVWNENAIDIKTKCIITVVSLMASGITDSSLKYHLENAKKNGVTKEEIAAIITHAAMYTGWPKGWAVFRLAKEVWE